MRLVVALLALAGLQMRATMAGHYLEHLYLDDASGESGNSDRMGALGGGEWTGSDAQHLFVLFTRTRGDPSPGVDAFLNASVAVQQKYQTSSLSFWVESVHDRHLALWEHDCPVVKSGEVQNDCLVSFEKVRPDRSCLMAPPVSAPTRSSVTFTGDVNSREQVEKFIKVESGAFIEDISGGIPVDDLLYSLSDGQPQPECPALDANSINLDTFLHEYWLPQKPVIIKNVKNFTELQLLGILSKYREVNVGAKLSPDIEFEGVDNLLNWEMAGEQDVPKKVLRQMQSPDRVVVRAAHEDMPLGRVLSLLTKRKSKGHSNRANILQKGHEMASKSWSNYSSSGSTTNVYVEYMPLDSTILLPLYHDLLNAPQQRKSVKNVYSNKNNSTKYPGFPSWMDTMRDGIPYLWLGDGFAVGKMHFDPFDNLLLQVEGSKTFKLLDTADNRRLYEGHMREAQLEARHVATPTHPATFQYSFRKRRLLESTSMVHTPVFNSQRPNVKDFPRSKDLPFMECKVDPGDMLFVPSYWWHEVVSTPGTIQNFNLEGTLADSYVHLNVAINHWFDPLFLKEYPCAVCRKYPNKKYGYALLDLVAGTSTPHN